MSPWPRHVSTSRLWVYQYLWRVGCYFFASKLIYGQSRRAKEKQLFANAYLQKKKSPTHTSSSVELRLDVPAFLLGHPVEKPKSKNYHLVVIYLLKRLFQCFCARVSTVLSHSDNLKHKRAWHAKVIFLAGRVEMGHFGLLSNGRKYRITSPWE